MTINKERVELWASALEAMDESDQCYGAQRYYDQVTETMKYCALGIGTKVAVQNGVMESWLRYSADFGVSGDSVWGGSRWHHRVSEFYGFESNDPDIEAAGLVTMNISQVNDGRHMTPWKMAQALRAKYLKDEG